VKGRGETGAESPAAFPLRIFASNPFFSRTRGDPAEERMKPSERARRRSFASGRGISRCPPGRGA